ncbi:MAG TPA: hypothetical protein VEU33_00075 [Archangium sp.]|nr:hypothetical protein [Archangium sp.]
MRADSSGAKGMGLLLALALLSNACVSLGPPPGRRMSLHYTPHGATGPTVAGGLGEEPPLARDSPPPSPPEPESPERLHRRRGTRQAVTAASPGASDATVWQSALATHLASLRALHEVSGSTRRISSELSRLKASYLGIARAGNGIFVRYVDYGEAQLRWIDAQLSAATELAAEASQVEEPDMQLALLRLAGPRLEAAMMGSMLLAVWVDFLNLTDAALSRRLNSVEALFMRLDGWQNMLEPAMTALASLEPEQVEAAARDMPALVGHLTRELAALLEVSTRGRKSSRRRWC